MSSILPAGFAERIVSVPVAELRRRPDHRSECVSECVMGSRLLVLESRDDGRWLKVLAPDGYRAWVRSWATADVAPRTRTTGLYVRAVSAVVRAEPAGSARIVSPLPIGARLGSGPSCGGWRRVALPGGRRGWIDSRAVEDDALPASCGFWEPRAIGGCRSLGALHASARVDRCVAQALELLGAPYRWGGASGWGLDCSGLIRLVLGLEGLSLPRDAHDQLDETRAWERAISPSAVQAGDLVFFGEPRGAIDHVGLGVGSRPGRFIHASGSVRVSGLNSRDPIFDWRLRKRVRAVIRLPFVRNRER